MRLRRENVGCVQTPQLLNLDGLLQQSLATVCCCNSSMLKVVLNTSFIMRCNSLNCNLQGVNLIGYNMDCLSISIGSNNNTEEWAHPPDGHYPTTPHHHR